MGNSWEIHWAFAPFNAEINLSFALVSEKGLTYDISNIFYIIGVKKNVTAKEIYFKIETYIH